MDIYTAFFLKFMMLGSAGAAGIPAAAVYSRKRMTARMSVSVKKNCMKQ